MDIQTISIIATSTIAFLSPYLVKVGETAAEKLGSEIYQMLKIRFAQKPGAQEALADLEKSPEDHDLQATLRVQLKKLLAEDEGFAIELQQLLKEVSKTESGSTIIKQVAGDNAKQFGQVFGDVTFK